MYRVGIDFGGTNIAAGVVDENYNILATAHCKTNAPREIAAIADDMARIVFEAIEKSGIDIEKIDSMGVGAPGAVNPVEGIVYRAENLDFYNVNLSALLEERVGKKFYLENDANAAAYGEFLAGAGKGTENFVAITLGTGVGGGIIIDKKIYSGSNFAGGEFGHMVILKDGESCNCGRNGCFEAYASATALINQTKQAMIRYPDTVLWELCENDMNKVSGRTAFDGMRKGDKVAQAVVNKYIEYLSVGVSNILNIFQPEVICIGGGISKEGKTLTEKLEAIVSGDDYAASLKKRTVIKTAFLGRDAGIIGAAFLADLYK